jgi:hypothetical protein
MLNFWYCLVLCSYVQYRKYCWWLRCSKAGHLYSVYVLAQVPGGQGVGYYAVHTTLIGSGVAANAGVQTWGRWPLIAILYTLQSSAATCFGPSIKRHHQGDKIPNKSCYVQHHNYYTLSLFSVCSILTTHDKPTPWRLDLYYMDMTQWNLL